VPWSKQHRVASDLARELRIVGLKFCRLRREALDTVKMVRLAATRGRHLGRHVHIGGLHFSQTSFKSTTHVTQRLSLQRICNTCPMQVPGCKYRPNPFSGTKFKVIKLGCSWCLLRTIVSFSTLMNICFSCVLFLQHRAKWLAGKNVSEMTCFLCRVGRGAVV